MGRWLETYCGWCHVAIPYLPEWSNIPSYCKSCNEWETKQCANPHCGGIVRYKIYWNNIHDYCDCNGWYEKRCDSCFQIMKVNCEWTNVPNYCKSCNTWKEKSCANHQCNGKVQYKEFWDKIPNYCSCKGWYEKKCENNHCNGTMRVHSDWSNIPKYCNCKGWYSERCSKCGHDTKNHCEWDHPKSMCNDCQNLSRKRNYNEIVKGTRLEAWLSQAKSGNVRDDGDFWHVTIYFSEGGHVSGDIDKYSKATTNVHGTLYAYDKNGNRVKGEDLIIND